MQCMAVGGRRFISLKLEVHDPPIHLQFFQLVNYFQLQQMHDSEQQTIGGSGTKSILIQLYFITFCEVVSNHNTQDVNG